MLVAAGAQTVPDAMKWDDTQTFRRAEQRHRHVAGNVVGLLITGVALPAMTFRLLVFATFIAGFRSFASLAKTELDLFRHDDLHTPVLILPAAAPA